MPADVAQSRNVLELAHGEEPSQDLLPHLLSAVPPRPTCLMDGTPHELDDVELPVDVMEPVDGL